MYEICHRGNTVQAYFEIKKQKPYTVYVFGGY